jgi:hypothetical protein
MTDETELPRCEICGEPMPEGETMFKFHGFSGPCPAPPLADRIAALEAELLKHTLMWYAERERREVALRVVQEQALDDGLWFRAERVTEAYLQAALRRLHAAIEGDA